MEALSQDGSGLGVWVERLASEREGSGEGVKDQSPGSQRRGLAMGAEVLTQVPECFLCQEGKDLGPVTPLLSLASLVESVDTG